MFTAGTTDLIGHIGAAMHSQMLLTHKRYPKRCFYCEISALLVLVLVEKVAR